MLTDFQLSLLLVFIPLTPLAAVMAARATGLPAGRSASKLAVTAGVISLACAIVEAGVHRGDGTAVRWLGPVWLDAGDLPLQLGLFADSLTRMWVLSVGAIGLLGLLTLSPHADTASDGPADRRLEIALLLLAALQTMLLSSGYWQMFAFAGLAWVLLARLQVELGAGIVTSERKAAAGQRRMILWGLVGDIPLAVGLLHLWNATGSFQWSDALAPGTLQQLGSARPELLVLVGLGIVLGVSTRCAQFPSGMWLGATPLDGRGLLWLCGLGILPGMYLLLRTMPLLVTQPFLLSLLTGLGGLSAVAWGVVSISQKDIPRTWLAFVAGTLSLVLMGVGTGHETLQGSLWFLTLNLMFLSAGVAVVTPPPGDVEQPRPAQLRGGSAVVMFVILIVAASGMPGQEAIVESLWGTAAAVANANGATAIEPGQMLFPLLALAAHSLLCLGLFRAVLQATARPRVEPASNAAQPVDSATEDTASAAQIPHIDQSPGMVLLDDPWLCITHALAGGSAVLLLVGIYPVQIVDWMQPGLTTLAAGVSFTLAWLLYNEPSSLPGQVEEFLGPFARLSRKRFYVQSTINTVVSAPLRGIGRLYRFWLDAGMDRREESVATSLLRLLGHWQDPLQTGSARFYIVTLMLTAAVFAAALML